MAGRIGRVGWWLRGLGRYVSIAVIAVVALLLLFHDLIQAFVPFNSTQLLAVSIAALALLLVEFNNAITHQLSKPTGAFRHLPMHQGLGLATTTDKLVGTLRVLVSTSETVLPILRASDVRIIESRVLIQDFSHAHDPKSKALLAKTAALAGVWSDLVADKRIQKLVLRRTDLVPLFFMVVFDETRAVFGPTFPTPLKSTAVEYLEPIFVDSTTTDGRLMIEKLRRQFDIVFEQAAPFRESPP
jgi:hypothetical protein